MAYLHDLKVDASSLDEWKHGEETIYPFYQACSMHAVAAFLRRVAIRTRLKRISLQDNAQDLIHGVDLDCSAQDPEQMPHA